MLRKLVILVVGVVAVVAVAASAADVETVSRVFRLEHVSVSEASTAVQPLLSEVGSLTLQPRLSRLTVQDVPDVIDRVASLIVALDAVPRRYRVQVDLLEGGAETPFGSVSEEDVDNRLRRMFKADAYYRLGRSTVDGEVGESAQADLGASYQVSFVAQLPDMMENPPWGAPDPGHRIQLRRLVLERVTVTNDGTRTTDELLRTNVLLAPRQKVYIGAGNSEDTEDVLVLIVQAMELGGS